MSQSIQELIALLGETVVGNMAVKESIAVAIRHRHLAARLNKSGMRLTPTNVLIYGESGSGKTEVIRELGKCLDIPVVSFVSTSFSETGYKGEDIETIIEGVLEEIDAKITRDYKDGRKSRGEDSTDDFLSKMLGKTVKTNSNNKSDYQRYLKEHPIPAIVFLDEIDKLIDKEKGGDRVSRLGVQRGLLGVISGVGIDPKGVIFSDKILWVGAGAFSGTSPSDLMPELLGRLNVRVGTDQVTEAAMLVALRNPKISAAHAWCAILKEDGLRVSVTDDGLVAIAEFAAWQNHYEPPSIGFRRVPAACDRIFKRFMIERPEGKIIVDRAFIDSLDLKQLPF